MQARPRDRSRAWYVGQACVHMRRACAIAEPWQPAEEACDCGLRGLGARARRWVVGAEPVRERRAIAACWGERRCATQPAELGIARRGRRLPAPGCLRARRRTTAACQGCEREARESSLRRRGVREEARDSGLSWGVVERSGARRQHMPGLRERGMRQQPPAVREEACSSSLPEMWVKEGRAAASHTARATASRRTLVSVCEAGHRACTHEAERAVWRCGREGRVVRCRADAARQA